jgi:hypothetical protein
MQSRNAASPFANFENGLQRETRDVITFQDVKSTLHKSATSFMPYKVAKCVRSNTPLDALLVPLLCCVFSPGVSSINPPLNSFKQLSPTSGSYWRLRDVFCRIRWNLISSHQTCFSAWYVVNICVTALPAVLIWLTSTPTQGNELMRQPDFMALASESARIRNPRMIALVLH